MVAVCILDIPDICSARYSSKDKQIYKDLSIKNLAFQNMDIFLIFPFSISYYYCQIEKMFSCSITYQGQTLVIGEKHIRNDSCQFSVLYTLLRKFYPT